MKITMYELLGMIKDGKAPKKIKTGNIIYELDDKKMIWADEIYHEVNKDYIWLNFKHINSLNDEVEFLEEEKKIPEKIDVISWDKCIHDVTHKEKELAIQINKTQELLNQVIDYLKSKGDE